MPVNCYDDDGSVDEDDDEDHDRKTFLPRGKKQTTFLLVVADE